VTEKACCGSGRGAAPEPAASSSCCGEPEHAAPAAPDGSCCCGPASTDAAPEASACCGAPEATPAEYRYGPAPYVVGRVQTAAGPVPRVSGELGRADRLGAWRVRWGIRRGDYRVRPGLYALGDPDATSPVLVTANYKLTFDALRASVGEVGAWLLVVDTRGINVWCAAGKGTFSAGEVARMVRESRLAEVVDHRRLILPQLSAPGVAAHQVREACGFRVTFGPVRAADIPAFLAAGRKADTAMRTVTFDLRERLVLAPAELKVLWDRRMLLAYAGAIAVSSVDGDGVSLRRGFRRGLPLIGATGLAVLAGGGITPALLPWLPGRSFSLKGAATGAVVAAGAVALAGERLSPAAKVALLAGVPAASSYAAMNFTGSSSITSPSGVEFEMRRAMPLQTAGAVLAAGAWLASRMRR
jgi:hypothetical protein